jgi:hypothetical protein
VQFPFPVGRHISHILKAVTATFSFAKEFRANPRNRSIIGMKWIKIHKVIVQKLAVFKRVLKFKVFDV